jgi:hypothetical protein
VENRIEYLCGEGQWAVDTVKKKIYLWPRTAEPEGIVAPTLKELIRIEGIGDACVDRDVPVRGIILRGLTFTCAKRDTWTLSDAAMQHDWEILDKPDALVRFKNAWRCGVEDCVFTQSGGTGVRFDQYAQNCFVNGCELSHLGQGGVMLLGYGPGTKDVNKYNSVTNCTIHDLGEIYTHSHGIALFQSSENRIAHNYIHHMPRKAICLNGVRLEYYINPDRRDRREFGKTIRWHEIKLPVKTWEDVEKYSHTRDNIIEYNNVEYCLMKMSDGAVINASGAGKGNIIRRNYVHHIYSAPGEGVAGAIRTDNDQLDTYIVENVIAHMNCPACKFKQQNYFINNVIYDVDPDGMLTSTTRWGLPNRGRFEKNIFIDIFGDSRIYGNFYELADSGSMTIDSNMYYRYRGDRRTKHTDHHLNMKIGLRSDTRLPYDEDLRLLRDMAHDTLSTYDVDPILADPENGDFRLSNDSPAHKLGIASIDVSLSGPQGRFERKL